jgi:hypothetical protein
LEIGTDILLVDGTEVVKDNTLIQHFDHFNTKVVVFWTIEDDERVSLNVISARERERESNIRGRWEDAVGRGVSE